MDGVLTDFDKAATDIGGGAGLLDDAPQRDKQDMWDRIEKAGEGFWANMPWMSGGKDLWKLIKIFNPILLTSPGKFKYAESGKLAWIKKNIPGTPVFFEDDKGFYAERDAILIDDRLSNISQWLEDGGIGILHENLHKTEVTLLKLLWKMPFLKPDKNHLRGW